MHDYKGAAEWFEQGSRVPGRRLVPQAAGGRHAGAGRPPQRVADAVPGARRVGRERLDPQGRGAPAAAARRDGRARRAARRARTLSRARRRDAGDLGDARARRLSCAPSRPIRDGFVFALGPVERRRRARRGIDAGAAAGGAATGSAAGGRSVTPIDLAAMPVAAIAAALGLIGLCIGSFLNVCIYRIPLEQSIVHPPSRCMRCGKALRWYHNVPVLSWLAAARALRVLRRAGVGALSGGRAADRRRLRAARVRVRAGPAAPGAAGRSRRC